MEGKKHRALGQDCRAVSEVYGQLLMMSIVVLAFSMIGLAVFSDEGAVKPEHIPHTDLQENFNRSANTVQIVHSGGEAIDKSVIKIIVNVNGEKKGEFDGAHNDFTLKRPPDGKAVNVFTLGDYIEIDTKSMNLNAGDDIEMYFIDTPSQQVIQKAVLQRGSGEIPDWITPHPYGSVYSSAENEEWQPTELVAGINDGLLTNSFIPPGAWVTENYTFGIDTGEMGISNSFNSVLLKIIYQVHGNSPGTPISSISTNGAEWTQIAPSAAYPDASSTTYDYDITPYVETASELEQLQVSFSAEGQAGGILGVDFVGIHVQ